MRFLIALLIAIAVSDAAFAQAVATAPEQAGFELPSWLSAVWSYVSTPAAVSGIIGFFMAVLPQGAPGTIWGYVRVVLDFIASNWGVAKNAAKA